MASLLAILLLGFVLGLRHATDADHVVAVTTIVSQQRSIRSAALIGAVWGAGHTLTILLVGGAIILFSIVIPPRLGLSMELSVALMLVLLGVINLSGAMKRIAETAHAHGHPSPAPGLRPAQIARSLGIGIVHGLAGSAAVALLVLTTVRDPRWGALYLLIFGSGTILGMMLLTSMIAIPFAFAAERFARVNRRMIQVTSLVSIGLGLFLAYKIGIADGHGLFSSAPHWTPE